MAKVTIYTQVYNAGPYLRQCLDSVLAQTHTDWEHIVADAGSTDGSVDILKEYAKDSRVKFIQLPKNIWSQYEMTEQYATGEYYASLDHDDWWEPEFLERLLKFIEKNDLDIAFTGVVQYYQGEGRHKELRSLKKPVVLTIEQFAQNYSEYGPFANARWASIMSTRQYLSMKKEYDEVMNCGFVWRTDSILMLKYMVHFKRIGIDSGAMQHYRIHAESQIQHMDPENLLISSIEYYNAVKAFLERFQAWTFSSRRWLGIMYLYDIRGLLNNIYVHVASSSIKLRECAHFLEHPLTCEAFLLCGNAEVKAKFIIEVKRTIMEAAADISLEKDAILSFKEALEKFSPDCAAAVIPEQFPIFAREPKLVEALIINYSEGMRKTLMDIIAIGKYEHILEPEKMLLELLPEGTLLHGIGDAGFIRRYHEICYLILNGKEMTALDQMTGILLDDEELYFPEDFLNIYLSLAAVLEQPPAFIFGKIRLARQYFISGQRDRCRDVLEELREMGAGDQEEVLALAEQLEHFDPEGEEADQ